MQRNGAVYLRARIVTETLEVDPNASVAVALITWVPLDMLFPCHVAEQAFVLAHVKRTLLSPFIVIISMLAESLALDAIFTLPLPIIVAPFFGDVIEVRGRGRGRRRNRNTCRLGRDIPGRIIGSDRVGISGRSRQSSV
jgi:hypothetical protein